MSECSATGHSALLTTMTRSAATPTTRLSRDHGLSTRTAILAIHPDYRMISLQMAQTQLSALRIDRYLLLLAPRRCESLRIALHTLMSLADSRHCRPKTGDEV